MEYHPHSATNNPTNRKGTVDRALLGHLRRPEIEFSLLDTDTGGVQAPRGILVKGFETGSGDRLIRIPYRVDGDQQGGSGWLAVETTEESLLDMNTTGIGGVIDGIGSLVTDSDYMIWALFDVSTSSLAGYVFTARVDTAATMPGGSNFGGTPTITVTAGDGWRFAIGCRVIIRASAQADAVWNQGTVTAQTNSTITVKLDLSVAPLQQPNSNLSGQAVRIIQITDHRPRVRGTQGDYGAGVNGAYAFRLVGTVRLDTGQNIRRVRLIGEPVESFPTLPTVHTATGPAQAQTICLGRWMGWGWPRARLRIEMNPSSGTNAHVAAGAWIDDMIVSPEVINPTKDIQRSEGWTTVQHGPPAVFWRIYITAGEMTATMRIAEWQDQSLI